MLYAARRNCTRPVSAVVTRALISVADKTGLVPLARALAARGVEIVSTGGTARALTEASVAVRDVTDVTGFPEILSGRVKTLHPKVHGGILAVRGDEAHRRALEAHGIGPIDLVVVGLYPFERTAASGADLDACVEQIDIGGPALLRAAAKNFAWVTAVCDPADYDALLTDLRRGDGATSPDLRRHLAAKVFARTAAYDVAIAARLAPEADGFMPERLALSGTRARSLRYGENPHQRGALYAAAAPRPGVVTARQVQGKELSFNNLADADAAFALVAEFDAPAVAIVKHANPAGAALGATPAEAYRRALACDPVSAFGGVVAVNRPLDRALAEEIVKIFTEVVIAPDAAADALDGLSAKRNLRVLLAGGAPDPAAAALEVRSLTGGWLVQSRDNGRLGDGDLSVATRRAPTDAEWKDLRFAWRVCKHARSNAVVLARDAATVGVGAGQMSRLDAVRVATGKAVEHAGAAGTVLASDAFFPFPDALLAAAEAGATAAIQPGGAMRDREVTAAADDAGLAMVFTGMRHFRH